MAIPAAFSFLLILLVVAWDTVEIMSPEIAIEILATFPIPKLDHSFFLIT